MNTSHLKIMEGSKEFLGFMKYEYLSSQSNEAKLSLKIMVDRKAKKVVFAEASKEFVDFIFNLMSLPLSAVTKSILLYEKGMAGSLGSLCNSIESLDTQCFEPNIDTDSVLRPRASVLVPLLSLDWPAPARPVYVCHTCRRMSDAPGTACACASAKIMNELKFVNITPKKTTMPGYVKGGVVYMVMDNLEVKPMSMSLIKSHVRDFYELEEKHVQVGFQEGLAILKASLETKNVLTTVFLEKI